MNRVTRDQDTNQVLKIIDPLGRATEFTYDQQGNITSITDAGGNVRTSTYEPTFSTLTSITDPLGNLTTFEYDTRGNLVAVTNPEQNKRPATERLKTRIAYNAFGQPDNVVDPLGNTVRFFYDAAGNVVRLEDQFGKTNVREYDLISRLTAQTDPRGRASRYTYDSLNRITSITDPIGGLTRFGYDAKSNLEAFADAKGNLTTHTFDAMGRLKTRTDPLGHIERFEYDSMGNVIRHTDRKGQVNSFTYDPLNRRVGANYADGTTSSFTYDAAGRLIQASDSAGGDILNSFDGLDRLVAQTTRFGTISYQYDAPGRRTQMTLPGYGNVLYGYDSDSRLIQVIQGNQMADLKYDVLGRRTQLTLSNGVSTEYQYDIVSRITALIYRNVNGVLGDLTYQYDSAGNRTHNGGSFAKILLPDPVLSAFYNSSNQQLVFGSISQTFDPNGNLLTQAAGTATTSYTWDARNRLMAISGPTGEARFNYDPFGRRIEKTINNLTTNFQYDGLDVIRESAPSGEGIYLRTNIVDEILARIDPAGTSFYIADVIGSTIALSVPTGNVNDQFTYDAFGKTQSLSSGTVNRFRFTGREDDEIGLYYYRARYYDPIRARFVQEDPLAENLLKFYSGDTNFYRYALDSPTNFVDKTGEGPVSLAVLAGICIAGVSYEVYHTNKLAEELEEQVKKVQKRIREIESYPNKDDIEKIEEIKELQMEEYKLARQKIFTYAKGYGLSLFTGIVCAGASALAGP